MQLLIPTKSVAHMKVILQLRGFLGGHKGVQKTRTMFVVMLKRLLFLFVHEAYGFPVNQRLAKRLELRSKEVGIEAVP